MTVLVFGIVFLLENKKTAPGVGAPETVMGCELQ